MNRVFTHMHSCNDNNEPTLTYSELTDYYNEFVLQLKLAEHNFNTAINLEIKETNRSESLKHAGKIIKLLNESILPALEFTVSYYTAS